MLCKNKTHKHFYISALSKILFAMSPFAMILFNIQENKSLLCKTSTCDQPASASLLPAEFIVREKSHTVLDWSHGTTAFLVFRVSAESSLFSRFSAAGTTEVIPNQSHAVATNKPTNFPYQGITFAPADPLTVESLRAPPSRGAIKQGPVKQTNN